MMTGLVPLTTLSTDTPRSESATTAMSLKAAISTAVPGVSAEAMIRWRRGGRRGGWCLVDFFGALPVAIRVGV
jgi:hypothetical protein